MEHRRTMFEEPTTNTSTASHGEAPVAPAPAPPAPAVTASSLPSDNPDIGLSRAKHSSSNTDTCRNQCTSPRQCSASPRTVFRSSTAVVGGNIGGATGTPRSRSAGQCSVHDQSRRNSCKPSTTARQHWLVQPSRSCSSNWLRATMAMWLSRLQQQ